MIVPKRKIIRTRKDGHILAQESDEEDNILLLDKLPGPSTQTQSLSPNRRKTLGRSQTANIQFKNDGTQNRGVGKTINEYDSATESENEPEDEMEAEDEDELILDNRKTTTVESASKKPPSSSSFPHLPTPSSSSQSQPSTTEYAPRPPPGRIIGLTYPLSDFRKNIASGDLVSKAVEDFGWALKEIVVERPFGGRRSEEVVEGLKEMRKVCLEVSIIFSWLMHLPLVNRMGGLYRRTRSILGTSKSNSHLTESRLSLMFRVPLFRFLPDLKKSCLHGQPGNPEFWSIFSKEGRNMSLISTSEAERLGGKSNISEDVATEVRFRLIP